MRCYLPPSQFPIHPRRAAAPPTHRVRTHLLRDHQEVPVHDRPVAVALPEEVAVQGMGVQDAVEVQRVHHHPDSRPGPRLGDVNHLRNSRKEEVANAQTTGEGGGGWGSGKPGRCLFCLFVKFLINV